MAIIEGCFKIKGLDDNCYLYSYLKALYKQGFICNNSVNIITKSFESFSWRLVSNRLIITACSTKISTNGKTLRHANKEKLITQYKKSKNKRIYCDQLFYLIIHFDLISRINREKIKNWENFRKAHHMLVAILIADLQQINRLNTKKSRH